MRRADAVFHAQQRVALQDRLGLEHVDRGHAGAAAVQRGDQRVLFQQLGTAGVDEQCRGLHPRQVSLLDDAAGVVVQAQLQRQHIAVGKQLLLGFGHAQPVGTGAFQRCLAAPDQHLHAEGPAVASQQPADLAIAPDPQGLAAQHLAQAEIGRHRRRFQPRLLPGAVLQAGDILGDAALGGHDQRPGQLGRRNRRTHAFEHGHASVGAGVQVDMAAGAGADPAGLADDLEFGQFFQQLPGDASAFADQHHGFDV
ncbi:hypothetical protein D9M72_356900 [compost metagenome]